MGGSGKSGTDMGRAEAHGRLGRRSRVGVSRVERKQDSR